PEPAAVLLDVDLDPRVRVALPHGVEFAELVVRPADEAVDVARRNVDRAKQNRQRRRVELAVTALRLEQEVVERLFGAPGWGRQGVAVLSLEVLLDQPLLVARRRGALRPLSCQIANAIGKRGRKLEVARSRLRIELPPEARRVSRRQDDVVLEPAVVVRRVAE